MFNDFFVLVRQKRMEFKNRFFVTKEGFEPSRPYEHHPLKMASLPFLHLALNNKDVALQRLE